MLADSGLYCKDEKEVMYKKSVVVQNKSSLLLEIFGETIKNYNYLIKI